MATRPVPGVQVALRIAGTAVPAVVSGTGPTYARNLQAVLEANGTANSLAGYVPNAKSGFGLSMYAHVDTAVSILNDMLNTAGITLDMQVGTGGSNGGATVTNCFAQLVEVSGPGGNNPVAIRGQFISLDKPAALASTIVLGSIAPQFRFGDTTHIVSLITTYLAKFITNWKYSIKRTIAEFPGANPAGAPTFLDVVRTECMFDFELGKLDELEAAQAVADCPTTADVSILVTQSCGGSATLHLVATAAEYDDYPVLAGDTEKHVTQKITGRSSLGAFSIAA